MPSATDPNPCAIRVLDPNGVEQTVYSPYPYQQAFHLSNAPNLLALGTRNTGKSLQCRFDAILRCLLFPGFKALILRRTMPELRRSHLFDIAREMKVIGEGTYVESPNPLAKFNNGSRIYFGHVESEADVLNYLGNEYGAIYFDELSTFTLDQFLMISASARAPKEAPYAPVVRAGSNPLGPGAEWMYQWFVDKTVNKDEFPDYNPDDFETQFSRLEQNLSADVHEYRRRLKNLPAHVRRAWLEGERVNEHAYFSDFLPTKNQQPWHVVSSLPTWTDTRDNRQKPFYEFPWIGIYRAIDWGYAPDPAVCLWIAVLPNGRSVVFKERTWKRTLAAEVAKEIKRESENMRILDSFCDPTMMLKIGQAYSIGEIFEQNGVPLTGATNDRMLYGYSIHNYLNTLIDGTPQLQIVKDLGSFGCPSLIKTLPLLQCDPHDARKLGDGEDHWAVALAYFCMGSSSAAQDPAKPALPRWMRKKSPWKP